MTTQTQNIPPSLLNLVLFSQGEVSAMATRFRDLKTEEYWNLAWPFFLSGIGGFLLRYLASRICFPYWLPKDFVSAFADALMIAGILGLLLDLFATRLLVQKVSDGLADKLVGRGLPAELQSHIRTIVNTGLVRDHYTKVYRLSPIADSEKLQVDVTLSFEAKNYSDATLDYAPIFQDEAIHEPEFVSLEYGPIGQFHYSAISDETDSTTKVKTVKGTEVIKLEPFRRNEKAICEVAMRYRLKMPQDYVDITDFAGATLGAFIRVENVPSGFEIVSSGETSTITHHNGDKSWHFDQPFVTGQHIRIWWFPVISHPISA